MEKIEQVLISRKDVMSILGVRSHDTFRKLVAEGDIPDGIKVGGRTRWNRAAILARIDRKSQKGSRG